MSNLLSYTGSGFDGVEHFGKHNTTFMVIPTRIRYSNFDISTIIPGVTKAIHCTGNEQNVGQCLLEAAATQIFKAVPPGSNVTVKDVGWVSCTGTYAGPYLRGRGGGGSRGFARTPLLASKRFYTHRLTAH